MRALQFRSSLRPARAVGLIGVVLALAAPTTALASTPAGDVRLTNDSTASGGYISNYTMVTGNAYTDATLAECSRSRGRQNEPADAVDPRNTQVIVGSSNDYCAVYNDGVDANGAPIPSGPIWLGYYRSENGGASFQSSLVPGYPGDASPYASRAQIRTASAGDPVLAWDAEGRLFAGSESDSDPALTKKTFGDVWVATYVNPGGASGPTIDDGKEFLRSVIVAQGSSAPNLLGVFNDKTAIEADRTSSACHDNVYFANSRFTGAKGFSNIYFYRSTNHGASFSHGTLLTTSSNSVQDPEISVTANGHVYVTWDATLRSGNTSFDVIQYAKSTDCGATFTPERTLLHVTGYNLVDRNVAGFAARDCGDGSDACVSGYTFFRETTSTRSTADQYSAPSDETVYVVYHASIPGTEVPTGTTFGTVGQGTGSQAGAYFVRLNGATGAISTPKLIDPTDFNAGRGHQVWPDVSADGGIVHVIWYDSRNDPCYSPARPISNCADRTQVPGLDTYGTSSTNGGASFATASRISDVTQMPNYEQFDGRQVPFHGDYLWVSSFGSFSFGTWTDQRNTVPGADQREGTSDADGDTGADVLQCRLTLPSGGLTGDTCPRAGGLDQNIYGDLTP